MGRQSEMTALVDLAGASEMARERAKVMLLTLGGGWSVHDGLARLGVSRTRFQDLRRTMLRAAVSALEERPAGAAGVCAGEAGVRGCVRSRPRCGT